VPDHLRGKYRAFCRQHLYPQEPRRLSNGLAHLKSLQEAGLNHVHLLPTYDYGSVPERPEEQAHVMVRCCGLSWLLLLLRQWFIVLSRRCA
jgi:pullulanase/glycogen debranching enzyme